MIIPIYLLYTPNTNILQFASSHIQHIMRCDACNSFFIEQECCDHHLETSPLVTDPSKRPIQNAHTCVLYIRGIAPKYLSEIIIPSVSYNPDLTIYCASQSAASNILEVVPVTQELYYGIQQETPVLWKH